MFGIVVVVSFGLYFPAQIARVLNFKMNVADIAAKARPSIVTG